MPAETTSAVQLSIRAYKAELVRRQHQRMMDEVYADAEKVRERCQSFAEFVKMAWHVIEPGTELKWNWHMQTMCDHLQAISLGKLKPRLIINVPPGSSKSTIVTVLWQAYEWGPLGKRFLRYVTTSYDLANVVRDTEKTLNVLRSEWYQSLWPEVELARQGVKTFSNTEMGTRQGIAFKSVTGKRGDRLVIDDPHSLDGAESEAERDKATRRFVEGGLNRINDWETSVIVVVMQRLHEEDLTGVLLARDFGFIHLFIPMEFEKGRACTTPLKVDVKGKKKNWCDPRSYDGQLMDPVRVPPEAVLNIKLSGEYMWAGQYQQRPAPREGGMFKVDLMDVVDHCPAGGMTVAGWDFAGSKRKKSAWTVRVLMTRIGGDVYIRDVRRAQFNPTEVEKMILDVSVEDRNNVPSVLISLPQDPGYGGKAVKWRISEILMGFNYKVTPETGDKATRAEPFAAQVGAERVHMVKGDWNGAYREELRGFPTASLKDQVDASSRAFQELVGVTPAPVNAAPELLEMSGPDQEELEEYEGDPWGPR